MQITCLVPCLNPPWLQAQIPFLFLEWSQFSLLFLMSVSISLVFSLIAHQSHFEASFGSSSHLLEFFLLVLSSSKDLFDLIPLNFVCSSFFILTISATSLVMQVPLFYHPYPSWRHMATFIWMKEEVENWSREPVTLWICQVQKMASHSHRIGDQWVIYPKDPQQSWDKNLLRDHKELIFTLLFLKAWHFHCTCGDTKWIYSSFDKE